MARVGWAKAGKIRLGKCCVIFALFLYDFVKIGLQKRCKYLLCCGWARESMVR